MSRRVGDTLVMLSDINGAGVGSLVRLLRDLYRAAIKYVVRIVIVVSRGATLAKVLLCQVVAIAGYLRLGARVVREVVLPPWLPRNFIQRDRSCRLIINVLLLFREHVFEHTNAVVIYLWK